VEQRVNILWPFHITGTVPVKVSIIVISRWGGLMVPVCYYIPRPVIE